MAVLLGPYGREEQQQNEPASFLTHRRPEESCGSARGDPALLLRDKDPARPAPELTFADRYTLEWAVSASTLISKTWSSQSLGRNRTMWPVDEVTRHLLVRASSF